MDDPEDLKRGILTLNKKREKTEHEMQRKEALVFIRAKLKILPFSDKRDKSTRTFGNENTGLCERVPLSHFPHSYLSLSCLLTKIKRERSVERSFYARGREKKINTPEREQKNKPLKRLMNFKSATH